MKKVMINLYKRVLPFVLTLMMLVSCTGCMATYLVSEAVDPDASMFGGSKKPVSSEAVLADTVSDEPPVSDFRAAVPLSEIKYTRPDTTALYTAIDALNARLDAGETDAESLVADFEHILDLFDELYTASSIAYYYHAMDVADAYYEKENNDLTAVQYDVDVALTKLSIRLYESPVTAEKMNAAYSSRFKEVCYLGLELNSEAVQPYIRRENELTARYDTLLSTFTVEDNGRTLTYDDIVCTADADELARLADKYYAELNAAAGEIYTELIEVRTAISSALGHSSYTGYAYKGMLRTYTAEDVRPLFDAVKKYIVPLYADEVLRLYSDRASDAADNFYVDRELFLRRLRSALNGKYPAVLEALDQLISLGNWKYEPDAKRMQSEFTLDFPSLGSSCICTFWDGTPSSAATFTHELGHYTRGYLTMGKHSWSATAQLDLDEMDSQGLQFLLIPSYPAFFGDAADAVRRSSLLDALYAIMAGCMEDEFQQEIFKNPSMTNDERNKLYARLADEYGFSDLFGYNGTEWVTIPHTFQSPFYYISYAVSVIPVLELLSLTGSEPEKAVAAYNELLVRGTDADFRETVLEMGLSDPLSPDTVKSVAKSLKRMF